MLIDIQDRLFTIGALLASDPSKKHAVPTINSKDVEALELEIDRMNEQLPEISHLFCLEGTPLFLFVTLLAVFVEELKGYVSI